MSIRWVLSILGDGIPEYLLKSSPKYLILNNLENPDFFAALHSNAFLK
jgi:hypothetical protein